ncbi:FkbM family methyltransferase [Alsobacter metallidurans]|nr:FkbM family methyltransferase [Alsobacter metallidurans]
MKDARTLPPAEAGAFGAFGPEGLPKRLIDITRRMPRSWAGRRIAYALRQIAIWLLRGRPVDVQSLGARMRLYPYNNVCEKRLLFTPQYFDPDEREYLAARIREGFTFVDVGSNVGGYALFVAALAGPTGRVLAVEPQPGVFERLVFNIRQNAFGGVKAVDCAVADKAGEVTLFVDPRNHGESSVKMVGLGDGAAVRVPATTLQQLLLDERLDHVDAIKLDVEGAEDLILEPFLRTAPHSLWPQTFIIENGVGRWQIDLPALLAEKGYRLVQRTRVNLIFDRG